MRKGWLLCRLALTQLPQTPNNNLFVDPLWGRGGVRQVLLGHAGDSHRPLPSASYGSYRCSAATLFCSHFLQETYGEDPVLTSAMTSALITGLQFGSDPTYTRMIATSKVRVDEGVLKRCEWPQAHHCVTHSPPFQPALPGLPFGELGGRRAVSPLAQLQLLGNRHPTSLHGAVSCCARRERFCCYVRV